MLLTHIGLDCPDACQVLLYDAVKVIVVAEHPVEDRVDMSHQLVYKKTDDRNGNGEDHNQTSACICDHHDCENEHDRSPEADAGEHLESLLHVLDISRHPCDKRGCREGINVPE